MSATLMSPAQVKQQRALAVPIIDIREQDAWRHEHIAGSRCVPSETLASGALPGELPAGVESVIFHCQSGMRTGQFEAQLTALVWPAQVIILQGGLNAWKAEGYPVITDRHQPLPLMRQVQLTAGAMALGGTLAGALLHPLFFIIPAFTGAGLMFAGITGLCGMARLLAVMPWNRRT